MANCCSCCARDFCSNRGLGYCYGAPLIVASAPNYLSDETDFPVKDIPTTGGFDRFILELPSSIITSGAGNTEPSFLSYGTPSAKVEMYTRHGGFVRTDMLVRAIIQRLHHRSPCVFNSAFRFRAVYATDPDRVNIIDCLPCTAYPNVAAKTPETPENGESNSETPAS